MLLPQTKAPEVDLFKPKTLKAPDVSCVYFVPNTDYVLAGKQNEIYVFNWRTKKLDRMLESGDSNDDFDNIVVVGGGAGKRVVAGSYYRVLSGDFHRLSYGQRFVSRLV